ncbi:MAG TPA: UrcA family protein [Rhizomicrobium sp.]|jgi:UrcA family protein|nr:UrcA family protein [Rhizomicrobium sp.]
MLKALVLGGAAAVALTMSASAQDYGRYDDASYQTQEEIQVTAPRYHADGTQKLNGTLEKMSLSTPVSYSDLDLRSRNGARELRARIRDAAADTCAQLADAYPVQQLQGTNCYKTALNDGLTKADEAISDARIRARYADYRRY